MAPLPRQRRSNQPYIRGMPRSRRKILPHLQSEVQSPEQGETRKASRAIISTLGKTIPNPQDGAHYLAGLG